MYKKILVPLDNSPSDDAIFEHIRELAKITQAEVILLHVADGYAARLQEQLNFADSEEIMKDKQYLELRTKELLKDKIKTTSILLNGDPAQEIINTAEKEKCDLIAMATHGHRFVKDIILGSVADALRHQTNIPILMIRSPQKT